MKNVSLREAQNGFTILELLVVMGLIASMLAIGTHNLRSMTNQIQSGAAEISGFLKQARAKAIASTKAYKVTVASENQLVASFALNCDSSSFQTDPTLALTMPLEVSITDINWEICFGSRGLPKTNDILFINDVHGEFRSIEVMLGGAIRVQ